MTYVRGIVRGPLGERTLEFLVDSGTMYTLLPIDVWQAIGLEAKRTERFTLADGTHMTRSVSECHMTLNTATRTRRSSSVRKETKRCSVW